MSKIERFEYVVGAAIHENVNGRRMVQLSLVDAFGIIRESQWINSPDSMFQTLGPHLEEVESGVGVPVLMSANIPHLEFHHVVAPAPDSIRLFTAREREAFIEERREAYKKSKKVGGIRY